MKFEMYVFDLDGTLIDSSKDICHSVNYVLNHYQLNSLSDEVICSYIGDGASHLIDRALGKYSINRDEALALFFKYYSQNVDLHTCLFPFVKEVLTKLQKQNKIIALQTNKEYNMSLEVMKRLQIYDFFQAIKAPINSALKPSPIGLNALMDEFNISKEQCLMIGDHHTDILAAQNAKCKSCFATYGIGNLAGHISDYSIDSLEDLFVQI